MTMTATRRWFGEQVTALGEQEIRRFLADGARLVVIEGLPGAGKSTLLNSAGAIGVACIDLDDFIPENADQQISWIDHVIRGGAVDAVKQHVADGRTVCICGAAAWPVLCSLVDAMRLPVARIYLKRVYTAGEWVSWDDGKGLLEHAAASPPYFAAIYGHHGADKPWERADLVIERK